ncbi:GNAT family N-acetyltransferase [Roseobacter sp. YSTF-M11]|uniref:GNAT family N-acetyltransferase n=1 Tax=Roseobacter insulae TaxID=2859783 RepID=A0A9X1K4F5_9RHOB|nr:GNAT family N-acetyltransferase [Roseobacter insulae]MBW4709662.1 GNAT family N-acetyltransferase [Roseobacter insulae]
MEFCITTGFDADERDTVAALYWQAFGYKLGRVLGPDAKALQFLRRVIDPDYALVARGSDGQILGIAGYKTSSGALVGGDYGDLQRVYGAWGALWRGLVLSVIERDLDPDILLMDGICVHADARGLGLGTALLSAIKAKALELEKSGVRLDVINTNPRARALYARQGFTPQKEESTGPFRYVFRFDTAIEMVWRAQAN